MKWRRLPRIGRTRVHEDVHGEVASHLALQIADLVADGWAPDAARAEALRRFGDVAGVEREMLVFTRKRENEMRRAEFLDELRHDLRIAGRQMRKRPLFALAAMVVIALGIGANAAVFAVVDAALLKPLPFANDEQLVFVRDRQGAEGNLNPSFPEFRDWERDAGFLQSVSAIFGSGVPLQNEAGSELIIAGMVSGNPEGTFGVQPIIGRWFTADEMKSAARVAMLDAAFWRERHGASANAIGQSLRVGEDVYTVIGVLPSESVLLRGGDPVALWLPFREDSTFTRGNHFVRVVGRLRDGTTIEQARVSALALEQRLQAAEITDHGIELVPVREWLVGGSRRTLLVLSAAVAFLMLILCANLANLFLSRSLDRGREFAVRAAMGASRWRLVRLVLTDSLLIGLIGGTSGLLLARALIGTIRGVVSDPQAVPATSAGDARVVAFTLTIAIIAGLLSGMWPALRAARTQLSSMLRDAEGGRAIGSRALWLRRKVLVGAEIALSVVLLASAGLVVRSLAALLNEPRGFDTENRIVFWVQLSDARYRDSTLMVATTKAIQEHVAALPSVNVAAATSHLPLEGGDTRGGFIIPGRELPDNAGPEAKKRVVSGEYFQAMAIPLLRGRVFTDADDRRAPGVAIISEAAARKYWPNQNPIGQRIEFAWGPAGQQEIIGVVGDVRHDGLHEPAQPMIYRPYSQFPRRGFEIVTRTSADVAMLEPLIRREVAALDPSILVFGTKTMDVILRESIAARRTTMLLLVVFSTIALVVAVIGVYAVTAQSVGQRTREIGVRAALGARPPDILRMVVGEEAAVIAVGVTAGLAGAFAATRLLGGLLYGVSPHDPVAYAAAVLLLATMALLASYVPARRAARVDPLIALRAD